MFQHRNKNTKKALIHSAHEINMDRDKLKELLNSNEIMEFNDLLGKKVYTLSLKEIGVLCNNLYKIINKSK